MNKLAAAAGSLAVATALAFASNATAAAISSYTLTNVPGSGFGGWSYDGDTLNDGIIPTTENDNMLLDIGSAPSITFTLNGFYKISDIELLSAFAGNSIPGNLYSALVTIGANSATVLNTGFGAINPNNGYFLNEQLTLPVALSSISTNTFTLSNFVSHGGDAYTALGEVNAVAEAISSYTLTNVPDSGFGGWSYDGDTLNDGIIPTTENDNMLLDIGSAPSITFTLNGFYKISDIELLSAFAGNSIPGNLYSALVTIGANSATVLNTGFGAINPNNGYFLNEQLTLPGSLSSISTNTFTLSNFVSQGGDAYTALGEVEVNKRAFGGGGVPEPSAWAMMLLGFGGLGALMRRRRADGAFA